MSTPPDAPYKLKQRAKHYATFFDNSTVVLRGAMRNGPRQIQLRSGRRYVIDPVTGQHWRPDTWIKREQARLAR